MRPVILVLLLLGLIALVIFLVLVIIDRVEGGVHHHQPRYYAALSQASVIFKPHLARFLGDIQVEKPPTFDATLRTCPH